MSQIALALCARAILRHFLNLVLLIPYSTRMRAILYTYTTHGRAISV